MDRIVVLDSGGQYCHLIARKVRELGAYAEIFPIGVDPSHLRGVRGVILSGGPSSVFADTAPQPQSGLFEIDKPMLGICYGHQLIARHLGGTVERGDTHEFGSAQLRVRADAGLFDDMAREQQVWMSHGDQVVQLPEGFETLADTASCRVAAMGCADRGLYGLQFHPEVVHTPHGAEILSNFLRNACACAMDWRAGNRVPELLKQIADQTTGKRVLFFLSGGVDSTVAHTLTVRALGPERVDGVYVNTGFMRSGETEEIELAFRDLNLGSLRVVDAEGPFMEALHGVVDPERKREIIGRAFLDVQDRILEEEGSTGDDWVLGQGTIYPDTIESGGTASADVIKTHHNRVERVQELIDQGRVLEPLSEYYKDEVREIGRALRLPSILLDRHPFPGPGLAIRCLCADEAAGSYEDRAVSALAREHGYRAMMLPLRSVGVQGDSRSYAQVSVLHGGSLRYDGLLGLSTALTNDFRSTNRVAVALAPQTLDVEQWRVVPATLTRERIQLLQRVDSLVTEFLRSSGYYSDVWQCPVVLLPLRGRSGETVALRPVTSVDGMTAAVARLPAEDLVALAERLSGCDGVDAVLLDVSHKPPATIEWE